MNKNTLLKIIFLLIAFALVIGIFFIIQYFKDEKNKKIDNYAVKKTSYKQANYNIMVASEIENYIEKNLDLENLKNNEKIEIKTDEILKNVSKEYESCLGDVEFKKINFEKYSYTIKSNCNDDSKKVIIKGYINPFETEDFHRVNGIYKTNYGYIALVDKPEIDEDDSGYAMYLESFNMIIKYDENMNEISRHNINIDNHNILDIEIIEDSNYSVLSEDENENYYISVFDEDFNKLYMFNTKDENLNFLRTYKDEYYYSYWDKIYKIKSDTKEITLIKDQTYDDNLREMHFKNNTLYATHISQDINKGILTIYNNEFNNIREIEVKEETFDIYANNQMIVSKYGSNPDENILSFYNFISNEKELTLTIDDIVKKLKEDKLIDKEYSNYSDIILDMQEDGLFIILSVQYYNSEISKYKTDNLLLKIDNDLNINLINVYKADFLEETIKEYEEEYELKLSSYGEFIIDNKYIEYITIRLKDDMLLYAMYE